MDDDFTTTLIDIIEAAGYDVRSYSGRGMNGKQCVGIYVEQGKSSFRVATEICLAALDVIGDDGCNDERTAFTFIQQLSKQKVSEDSLGLGNIVYFPNVKWNK